MGKTRKRNRLPRNKLPASTWGGSSRRSSTGKFPTNKGKGFGDQRKHTFMNKT